MNVYFVRHGESEGNRLDIHQDSNVVLSEDGERQAKFVAKRLKNISIDIVYSSPFARTKRTAEIISRAIGKKVEYWEALREGKRPTEIEGLSVNDPKSKEVRKVIAENWLNKDFRYSDEDTVFDLMARAQSVFDHLLEKHKDQNILCVSHGGIMKMIVSLAIFSDKLTPEIYMKFNHHAWISNTGITHLSHSEKYGWQLRNWNDIRHLG